MAKRFKIEDHTKEEQFDIYAKHFSKKEMIMLLIEANEKLKECTK
jgi:hypothetical protein